MSKARVYVGTSGYSYHDWKGIFYPRDLREKEWLEYYARFFDTVELNVTFYRLPGKNVFSGWRERTPKDFEFTVKGSRFITHVKKLKGCSRPLELFFSRIRHLKEKLGPVLWQLPPTFKKDKKLLMVFIKALGKYKNIRHVFEFRNETWYCKEIFDILKRQNISLCSADWPPGNKNIVVTVDFIYLRRHGQGDRLYSGCYSKPQLKKDARAIKRHLKAGRNVYIYFNNDAHGYAVRNALELKKIL